MNKQFSSLVLIPVSVAALALMGCDDGGNPDDSMGKAGSGPTQTGGSATGGLPITGGMPMTGGTGTGGSGTGMAMGVLLEVDPTGWVDGMFEGNTVKVQGAWYPYGDSYGDAKCTVAGGHMPEECSVVTSPVVEDMSFPNVDGKMCVTGTVAKVLMGADKMPDYANMWGAGIGLDLNASGGLMSVKQPYDAAANGVVGVSFDIDAVPLSGLRVEFPTVATETAPDGADYWGASMSYPASPVKAGTNVIDLTEVKGPKGNVFDKTKLLSLQFHVPTSLTSKGEFAFCISNVTMLTSL